MDYALAYYRYINYLTVYFAFTPAFFFFQLSCLTSPLPPISSPSAAFKRWKKENKRVVAHMLPPTKIGLLLFFFSSNDNLFFFFHTIHKERTVRFLVELCMCLLSGPISRGRKWRQACRLYLPTNLPTYSSPSGEGSTGPLGLLPSFNHFWYV